MPEPVQVSILALVLASGAPIATVVAAWLGLKGQQRNVTAKLDAHSDSLGRLEGKVDRLTTGQAEQRRDIDVLSTKLDSVTSAQERFERGHDRTESRILLLERKVNGGKT